MSDITKLLPRGLIVSCQAPQGSPLRGSIFMAAMAKCAELAGAIGIRADGPDDVRAIREVVDLPIIGIYKRRDPDSPVYITPSMAEVDAIVAAGAHIVAIDATDRPRTCGVDATDLIREIHLQHPNVYVMADISTFQEGKRAAQANADLIATTLAGYTQYSSQSLAPDLNLISNLAIAIGKPIIAEGRFDRPELAAEALRRGAYAVVVGTAITNPIEIARRFVSAIAEVI